MLFCHFYFFDCISDWNISSEDFLFVFERIGHQGGFLLGTVFYLVKGTVWGNCEFPLKQLKGTKAMTRGHGGNCLCCLREISGLYVLQANHNSLTLVLFIVYGTNQVLCSQQTRIASGQRKTIRIKLVQQWDYQRRALWLNVNDLIKVSWWDSWQLAMQRWSDLIYNSFSDEVKAVLSCNKNCSWPKNDSIRIKF